MGNKIFNPEGASYIGSGLFAFLFSKGYAVTILSKLLSRQAPLLDYFSNPKFNYSKGEICDYFLMKKMVFKADTVIRMAAIDKYCDLPPALFASLLRTKVCFMPLKK